jgi:hypothetical protein
MCYNLGMKNINNSEQPAQQQNVEKVNTNVPDGKLESKSPDWNS